jgi:hypothetical protein
MEANGMDFPIPTFKRGQFQIKKIQTKEMEVCV